MRHGLRNGLIPVITIFGFQAGLIFSGAVITETVFNIPGMGRLFVESVVEEQDYTSSRTSSCSSRSPPWS